MQAQHADGFSKKQAVSRMDQAMLLYPVIDL
jgi:hypothetical protein